MSNLPTSSQHPHSASQDPRTDSDFSLSHRDGVVDIGAWSAPPDRSAPHASYAESTRSTLTPSTILPTPAERTETNSLAGTDDDNTSIHSRTRLFPSARAASLSGVSYPAPGSASATLVETELQQQQRRRRATIANLYNPGSARAPTREKPKKTRGRKVFEGFCDVVEFVVPLDVDDGKTSMKESSLMRRRAKTLVDLRQGL